MPGDAEILRGIYDSGCNLVGPVRADCLDPAAAAGLQVILADPRTHANDDQLDRDQATIARDIQPLVDQVGRHAALFGFYVRDEPHARLFPLLARYVAALQQAAPDVRPCINLFPNYASPEQLGTASYEAHLEQYLTTVRPPFLCYDHYALMEDGSLRDLYFPNLEAVRAAALAHELPFWNVVLSNVHFHYAEPSPAGLRFQAYTTLAYGARGIAYFTYVAPIRGNYRLSPINQFGDKTPTWQMLREVNLQIHALAPTLITLKSVGVFHHPDVPRGCHGLGDSRLIAELSGSGRFVVGEFLGPDGAPTVLIVNKDLRDSTSFNIRFQRPGKILQTNSYTGQTGPWVGESNWLAPGQGMLLSLESE